MDFVLDHRIRDWVFIPILYVMFMFGILKIYIQKVMSGKKAMKTTSKKAKDDMKDKGILMKCNKLRSSNGLLTSRGFYMRKWYMNKKEGGLLFIHEEDAQADALTQMSKNNPMMGNPNNMIDMLKNNLFMTLITPLQYVFISYFFTGYIVGKVPFPLTQKFREMLQRGIEVSSIDVKYVSALSLYLLTIYGFQSLYRMIFTANGSDMDAIDPMNDPMQNPMAMNQQMMGGGGNPFQQQEGMKGSFKAERENLDICVYESETTRAERRILKQWRSIKSQRRSN